MRQASPLDLGLEVHQDAMAVASVAQAHGAEVIDLGALGTRPGDLDHRIRTRPSQAPPRILRSEAGPWGSWLDRYGTQPGDDGWGGPRTRAPNGR